MIEKMIEQVTNRSVFARVILSVVLVLGIVQWSFLPILIQNGPVANYSVFEVSGGHSAKFAAPYPGFFGDALRPVVTDARLAPPQTTTIRYRLPADYVRPQDDIFFAERQLRAPPSL